MRRTKAQAAETGRQILQAAETLFLEEGYDNVSLEQIAAAAGITRGAVHWHYKNKQGLLLALQDDAQAPFRSLADHLDEESGPALLQRLDEVISNVFEKFESDPRQKGLIRVLLRLDITLSDCEGEGGSTFRDEMFGNLARIFRKVVQDAGLPPPWLPETAASALSATISGLVGEWALGKGNFRLAPDGQAFIRMVLQTWTNG
ncbi:TetR/AcrR family transcriptional regulator [Ancylobacter sp. IITR112]|uniref:TetR/AcrR family transcriptional regulator n=1 Tax=Ancylobacter sp. IITR112 TaxID=3138073 RepID=UPI00352A52D5